MPTQKKAAKKKVKAKAKSEFNKKEVLKAAIQSGEISRQELAERLGVDVATIRKAAEGLINDGILSERDGKPNGCHQSGRPVKLLKVKGQSRLVLAVDLEPELIRVALVGMDLSTIVFVEATNNRLFTADKIIDRIVLNCKKVISVNALWRDRIIGICVSLPGLVDLKNGIACSSTNMPNWRQVDIVNRLTCELRLPVMIERSIHLAALSEKWRRPDTHCRNVMCVVLRTGIGAAMLIKGNVYAGANNLDGEIGHTVIDIEGKRCECGKRGCLETFISSDAIRGKAIELVQNGRAKRLVELADGKPEAITTEMIYKLSQEGDADCVQIVRYLMNYLCYGIANLINIFDPHELVICGSIDIAEDIVLEEMNSRLKELLLPDTFSGLKIHLTPYKERASLIGAACMVIENYNPR